MDFEKFNENRILVEGIFLNCDNLNLSLGHMRSHTKCGPDRFCRFDVYWIKTDRQADTHTIKVFIDKKKLNLLQY